MGVPGFRRSAVLLIAAAAAMLLFMFSSGSKTTAVSFGPGYFAALSSTAPGADADITTIFSLPAPDSLPGGGVFAFTPRDWELAELPPSSLGIGADLAIDDGSVVGSLTATVNLGIPALGADACFIPVSIPFTLVDANASPTSATTVAGSPNDPPLNVWPGFRAVPNSPTSLSLVPAAVPGWPDFLNPILAHLGGATPIARYYGQVNLVGEVIALNLLLFSPGAIPGFDAGLGYVAVPVLQDPFTPPPPDPLGAVCTNAAGPFAVTTIKGVTVGEPFLIPLPPCTLFSCPAPGIAGSMFHPSVPPNLPFGEVCNGVNDDGDATLDEGCNQVNRTNPSAPGTYLFELIAISDRDTDNDGIENPLDSCPLIVDATSTGAAAPFPGGFGWNPRFPGPQPQDADFDGLPGSAATLSCDPNNNQTNLDEDSDLFSNLKDNCPSPLPVLAPIPGIPVIPIVSSNFSQAQAELFPAPAPNDGGPFSDGMGDPCDPNPTISDGHFHRAAAEGPVCLGLADGDGDGYCDADEIALGSNPGNPFSQPEDISGLAPGLLALGKVCSDGIDNDNDGLKDLADPGCQLPRHDIRFGPPPILFGPPNVTAPTVQQYTFFVRNFSFPPSTETVQVGVLVDPLTACPTAHVIGFSASAGASLVSVDLGQDGQANFDSGGAPGPGGPLGSTATDLEPEGFGLATLTLQPGPNPPGIVRVLIRFDNCGGFPNPGNDFLLTVDICHSGDPASLGLFSGFPPLGLSGAGCSGSNDGFQDRPPNNINDAPLSRMINDTTCC